MRSREFEILGACHRSKLPQRNPRLSGSLVTYQCGEAMAEAILERLGVSALAFINMTYRQVILKKGIPFHVALPSGIKTRDTMTDAEFDEMTQRGLEQAKMGRHSLMRRLLTNLCRDSDAPDRDEKSGSIIGEPAIPQLPC